MKIRFKLLLIVFIIFLNFGFIILLSRWAINEISQLKDKTNEGTELIANLRQMKNVLNDLQYTMTLDLAYDNFERQRIIFERSYNSFINSPKVTEMIVKQDLQDESLIINNVYSAALTKIENMNIQFSTLKNEGKILGDIVAGSENFGLYVQYNIVRNDYVYDLLTDTRETVNYFSETFESILNPFMQSLKTASNNLQNQILLISLMITIVMGLISTIFVFIFSTSLSNRINNVSAFVQKIADGDFTAKIAVKTHDEIFDLINNIRRIISFENILFQIRNTAKTLNESYLKTKDAVDNVHESINKQATSIEDTISAFKVLMTSINEIANNALKTNVIALDTKNNIQTSTNQIRDTIKEINVLSQSASKIMGMLKIINSITEQTDLLSLNAAIEAARAGDAGKGFAVVASEIRKLAETSAEATKEVSLLTREIISHIKQTTAKTETSAEALQTMESSIVQVVDLIEEIANSTEQESESGKNIMNAVTRVNGLSSQNKENADKIIFNNMYLKREVDQLHSLVGKFKLSELTLEKL